MKNLLVLFFSAIAFIACASDTGAIYITEKERDPEPMDTAVDTDTGEEAVACPTVSELLVTTTCANAQTEMLTKKVECQQLYNMEELDTQVESGELTEEEAADLANDIMIGLEACYAESCVPELSAYLDDQTCRDDCSWMNQQECGECVVRLDPYGWQAYWMVVMESCVCTHEEGVPFCSDNCDNQTFLPEEITQQCTDNFISNGGYQDYLESCYISDFATACANNLLCETFWASYQECRN